MWLKVDGFKDLVKGLYSFILASNLKVLMEDLKAWNKGVCGDVAACKCCALDLIDYWDGKEREGHLSLEERDARRLAVEEFNYWAVLEETS